MILKKIAALNKIALESMGVLDNTYILKKCAEESIKILKADYGLAYSKFSSDEYELIYKSSKAPRNPPIPKDPKGPHHIVIPIIYGEHLYGNIILGYTKKHTFSNTEIILVNIISSSVTNAITVNWLVENEQKALALAEKQKETQILLDQEKIKTEFISNATHEFRTPLAIMRGNVDLELNNKSTSKKSVEKTLKAVRSEIIHLSVMLGDLSALTKGKHHKDEVNKLINIEKLLTKAVKRLEVFVYKKKISIKIKKDGKNNIVKGDEEKLEKMFLNLIRNAIVYGKEKGNVTIHINQEKNKLIIKVADDGVGIPKDELPYIFERFYRTKAARQMTTIGTGLGLAIVRDAVESHKGTIVAESKESVGTTFTVSLPLHR